ncbi:MAG: glycosyltransferase family 39 protein [Candidatus Pacebacteria bacterium]|nr:glycosyltransferase family 39 protein [Candidatus Paceibacterota bacterium]
MELLLKDKSRAFGAALVFVILVISSFLLLYKLGSEPLQDYDETTYAEVTAESLASHHLASFTFLGNPYFNKPPLLFWLMDGTETLMHETEAAARLPSALAGIVLIATVMLTVFWTTRSIYGAAFGGAILAATSAFIEPARQVRFDVLVSLFIMLSLYAFLRGLDDRRWYLLLGIFVGLGVLSKDPIELFAIVAMLAAAAVYRRIDWLRDPYLWGGVGISLLVALPWHLYETFRFGEHFWDVYIGNQVIARVQTQLFSSGPTNADYFTYLFQFAAPWAAAWCIALLAAFVAWRKLVVKEQALLVASIAGVVSVMLVCLVTETKAISYMIPLYPFMAITIAMTMVGLGRFRIEGLRTALVTLAVCLTAYGLWLSAYNGFHLNGYYASGDALAKEEKTIGEDLLAHHATQFYIYDTTTLGSVMYYSRIVASQWISSLPPKGSYLLYQTDELRKLEEAYPQMRLASVYQGVSLSLGVIE